MSQPSWRPWEGEGEASAGGVPDAEQGRGMPRPGSGADVPVERPYPYRPGEDVPERPWRSAHAPVARPWPGYAVPQTAPSMLASHADRERAVDVLRAGYGEGRMEKEEFDRRVGRAYAARTVGELALLVADLPQGPVPQVAAAFTAVPRTFLPARGRGRTGRRSGPPCAECCVCRPSGSPGFRR